MLPYELAAIHYLTSDNQSPFPTNIAMMQNNFSRYQTNNLLNSRPSLPVHEFTPQSSSTSDEAEEEHHQVSIIDERRQRRMISNRESARRSRMRKQKHLDELWSQLVRLRTENHTLVDKLNHVSDCHDRVLQENARLKEETSDLRQMLTHLRIGTSRSSPNYPPLRDLEEEVTCDTAHLRAESSSNQSITTTSTNLLH